MAGQLTFFFVTRLIPKGQVAIKGEKKKRKYASRCGACSHKNSHSSLESCEILNSYQVLCCIGLEMLYALVSLLIPLQAHSYGNHIIISLGHVIL